MAVMDIQYTTVTCDSCGKTVTYQNPNPDMAAILTENPWMKTNRMVQTADRRVFSYCSDLCNVAGIETGLHNVQEAPKVAIPQGSAQAQIAAAAAAAKAQEQATKAIKEGGAIQLK